MTDSVTMLAERRENNPDSAPFEHTYMYYYWCAAIDDLAMPVILLPTKVVLDRPEDKVFRPFLRRPAEADIEMRLNAAKDKCLLLFLRSGGCGL